MRTTRLADMVWMYEVRALRLLMLDELDNYDYQMKVQPGASTLFHLAKLTEVPAPAALNRVLFLERARDVVPFSCHYGVITSHGST